MVFGRSHWQRILGALLGCFVLLSSLKQGSGVNFNFRHGTFAHMCIPCLTHPLGLVGQKLAPTHLFVSCASFYFGTAVRITSGRMPYFWEWHEQWENRGVFGIVSSIMAWWPQQSQIQTFAAFMETCCGSCCVDMPLQHKHAGWCVAYSTKHQSTNAQKLDETTHYQPYFP